uniref:Uncharacterized protein n=1 Tax=Ralstonia solanacearum TaxID=305 RepID=A0A0S4UEB9_RALSL|nr:protein of unknown function [Ralstonia solanacearum]
MMRETAAQRSRHRTPSMNLHPAHGVDTFAMQLDALVLSLYDRANLRRQVLLQGRLIFVPGDVLFALAHFQHDIVIVRRDQVPDLHPAPMQGAIHAAAVTRLAAERPDELLQLLNRCTAGLCRVCQDVTQLRVVYLAGT